MVFTLKRYTGLLLGGVVVFASFNLAADEPPGGSILTSGFESDPDHWRVDQVPIARQVAVLPSTTLMSFPQVSGPTGFLSGRVVYLNAGHGWTFHDGLNTWVTQRGITHEMNEDYGNLDQMTLFAQYCIRAGGTVVPMRPIGFQTNEVVLDNDSAGVSFSGSWINSSATLFYGSPGDVPYRYAALSVNESATATYTPNLPVTDFYPVYTWVAHGDNRTAQLYRILHTGGQTEVRVPHHQVGNGWVYLGTYYFNAGFNPSIGSVVISDRQSGSTIGSVVIADAIRFGNGMGSIGRGPQNLRSGYPREEEASRYWIQAGLGQGQSATLYDGSGDDTADNVGAPIRLAREMNRTTVESNRFKRVYISFHSNAGGGRGTLGLYNNNALFPGTGTANQFRLAELLGLEINNDLSAMTGLEVPWFNRGNNVTFARSDYAFGEIRDDVLGGEMDATIIEVGFHDDLNDARLMRDPKVRLAAARSTSQGLVRFFNQFDSLPLVFPPEPPRNLRAISTGAGVIRVSWSPPLSVGGSGPVAEYRIYRSTNGYGFGLPVLVNSTFLNLTNLGPGTWFFQVTAANAAGESLASETVGVRPLVGTNISKILVVNGFDRFERRLNPRQTPDPLVYIPPGPAGTMERVILRKNNSFDYVVQHGLALNANGASFDSCQNEAVIDGSVSLQNYPAVIWASGNESTADETFNPAEQSRVTAYLAGGGNIFVTGSEVAWDLDRSAGPTAADRNFLNQQLRASLGPDSNDDAQTDQITPSVGGIFSGNISGRFDDGMRGIYAVLFPDQLVPAGGSVSALQYQGGLGGTAAVQYDGSAGGGKTIFWGFPFETLVNEELREGYLADVLKFFGLLERPRLLEVRRISVGSIQLVWSAIPGQSYQFEYKNFLENSWLNLGGVETPANSTATNTQPILPDRRFYRIRLLE